MKTGDLLLMQVRVRARVRVGARVRFEARVRVHLTLTPTLTVGGLHRAVRHARAPLRVRAPRGGRAAAQAAGHR